MEEKLPNIIYNYYFVNGTINNRYILQNNLQTLCIKILLNKYIDIDLNFNLKDAVYSQKAGVMTVGYTIIEKLCFKLNIKHLIDQILYIFTDELEKWVNMMFIKYKELLVRCCYCNELKFKPCDRYYFNICRNKLNLHVCNEDHYNNIRRSKCLIDSCSEYTVCPDNWIIEIEKDKIEIKHDKNWFDKKVPLDILTNYEGYYIFQKGYYKIGVERYYCREDCSDYIKRRTPIGTTDYDYNYALQKFSWYRSTNSLLWSIKHYKFNDEFKNLIKK